MPHMRGDELIAEIRRRWIRLRIIMVTAFAQSLLTSGKPNGDADYILEKPFRLDDLRAAIAKVMA